MTTAITVAFGDGESPKIMEQALFILKESGADISVESIEIGKRIYDMDSPFGILPSSFDSLARTRILLKGPTALPDKEGVKDVGQVIKDMFRLDSSHRVASEGAQAFINESMALFEPLAPFALENMLEAVRMLLNHIGQGHIVLNASGLPGEYAL